MVAVATILLVAVAGYAWLIPVRRADAARLATFAPTEPPAGFTRTPAGQGPVTASRIGLTELRDTSKADPNEAGAYSVEWVHHSAGTGAAEVIVLEVPTAADGATLRKEAANKFTGKKGVKASGATPGTSFAVASLPGVSGITFTTPSGTSTSTTGSAAPSVGHGATVVVGRGRMVAVALVEEKGTSAVADVSELARRSLARLDARGAGVSLSTTSIPMVATLVYAAGVVLVLGMSGAGVVTVRRVRRRRAAARVRAAERERLTRGRRVVKRQARRPGPRRPTRWR